MGFLSDLNSARKKWHGQVWEGLEDDPERLFMGFDPVSTELWNKILGRDDEPLGGYLGGPSSDQKRDPEANYTAGERKAAGIGQGVAGILGAIYGGGALLGGGGAGGASGGGGGMISEIPASSYAPLKSGGIGGGGSGGAMNGFGGGGMPLKSAGSQGGFFGGGGSTGGGGFMQNLGNFFGSNNIGDGQFTFGDVTDTMDILGQVNSLGGGGYQPQGGASNPGASGGSSKMTQPIKGQSLTESIARGQVSNPPQGKAGQTPVGNPANVQQEFAPTLNAQITSQEDISKIFEKQPGFWSQFGNNLNDSLDMGNLAKWALMSDLVDRNLTGWGLLGQAGYNTWKQRRQ